MVATTKLIVFNDVLRELGGHPLANLTNANTRLSELTGAFDHAIEFMLAKMDWGFARRRATLTGVVLRGSRDCVEFVRSRLRRVVQLRDGCDLATTILGIPNPCPTPRHNSRRPRSMRTTYRYRDGRMVD
jgi:hypothetical protein